MVPLSFIDGTGIGDTSYRIHASDDIFVFIQSYSEGDDDTYCSGYALMPIPSLGSEYYAVTWKPSEELLTGNALVYIIATEASSTVYVTLPSIPSIEVNFRGITYGSSDEIRVELEINEVFQIEESSHNDLTGTYITSEKPIAVFSGHLMTDIGAGTIDAILEQMSPVHTYGKLFVAVPPFDNARNNRVKVVAAYVNTVISTNLFEDIDLRRAGSSEVFNFNQPLFIESTKPIIVIQFTDSEYYPSSLIIAPIQQYQAGYVIAGLFDRFDYMLTLVVDERYKDGFILNGEKLRFDGESVSRTDYVTQTLTVNANEYIYVYNEERSATFSASIYGTLEGRCSYAFTSGMCLEDSLYVSNAYQKNRHIFLLFIVSNGDVYLIQI